MKSVRDTMGLVHWLGALALGWRQEFVSQRQIGGRDEIAQDSLRQSSVRKEDLGRIPRLSHVSWLDGLGERKRIPAEIAGNHQLAVS